MKRSILFSLLEKKTYHTVQENKYLAFTSHLGEPDIHVVFNNGLDVMHAVSVYKKHPYKKQLVRFLKTKKL